MAARTSRYHDKKCAKCRDLFTPTGPRSTVCDECREGAAEPAKEAIATPQLSVVRADAPPPAPELSALDVIDAFALDFNTGNAVRFLLERADGDELSKPADGAGLR